MKITISKIEIEKDKAIIVSRLKIVAVKVKYSPFCFGHSSSEVGCCHL